MKIEQIKDTLIDGYLCLKEGEQSFREWIKKNISKNEMPDSLIGFYYDSNESIKIGCRKLKDEFQKNSITWPLDSGNEIRELEEFYLDKYNKYEISGVDLIAKCHSIAWKFEGSSKYTRMWDFLNEDLHALKSHGYREFIFLMGKDVEMEIEKCLFDSGAIAAKRKDRK